MALRDVRAGFGGTGTKVGRYRRVLENSGTGYVLELEPGAEVADRRLVVAFAVGLDALHDR